MRKMLIVILVLGGCELAVLDAYSQGRERIIYDESKQGWIPAEELERPLRGMVGEAQELMRQGKARAAEKILKKYIKETTSAEPDRAQAMLLYADAAFMRGEYGQADKRYKQVINDFPNTREFAISIRRELDIAKTWLGGKKKRVLGILFLDASDEALDILSQIEQLAGGYRIAEVSLWTKGEYYFKSGQFELAEISYRRLAKDYKSPRYRRIALSRASASAMASFPGIYFDDTPLLEAGELYNEYLENFPNEAKREDVPTILEQIRVKRAEKEFEVGRFYRHIHKPVAAEYYFRYVMKTWPDTLWAQQSRTELARMGFSVESES
ncbi:MAG: outer membrane protein assembly factor BamD [Phycisphaerae bacterium]